MKNTFSSLLTFALLLCLLAAAVPRTNAQLFPFRDPKLPLETRVNDLVSRMSLDEKISQMMNGAAGIDRLGMPEYEWWNEALHGVARSGVATVFPQAIGMAATFDAPLVQRIADVTATEGRAKHHEFARKGQRLRYQGLTFWSPNINIFRDPRWGRGQETWGEDPYLTGLLGSAFVKGLQGNDPKYLKTVSTVKHYAVHSGPEPERHAFDAIATKKDLEETYLPAFRTTIIDAGATGVMCAYNRLNGEAACASKELYDILFNKWNFKGHVVSDCGAIDNIFLRHKIVKTEAEASAMAVKGGTDLTCGREYKSLGEAVKLGLIKESEIDTAVKNLMRMKFRLGMFDPIEMVKYAQTPYSANDTEANRRLSLLAAQRSLVMLKNYGNVLPLPKALRNVAVIGPNADDVEVLLGNYNGEPSHSTTPFEGIRQKLASAMVTYSPGMYATGSTFEVIDPSSFPGGLRAEYFNNGTHSGEAALERTDPSINFNWYSGSPAKEIKNDGFSVRWTGKLTAVESGRYSIGARGAGPFKIWIDGKEVHSETTSRRTRNALGEFEFVAGQTYDLRVEYAELANQYAQMKLVWMPPNAQERLRQQAIENARNADAVVMVMGISPSIEGEEMPVKLDGFRGGDRTEIELPKPQQQLIKDIHAVGKPVILVTMGGSALAMNWESENVHAIIHAWYPGPEGGKAIADVIFGDHNPSGRLPVTFYKSVDQLPPFDDYRMDGRTYRFFKGEPLYPFGYGLSYSTFGYAKLKAPKQVKAGGSISLSVEVSNTGRVAGDEIVQLYLTNSFTGTRMPIRSLAGVQRVFLGPGEKKTVSFSVDPRAMSVVLDDGRRVVEPGEISFSIGGGQPGNKMSPTIGGSFKITGSAVDLPK